MNHRNVVFNLLIKGVYSVEEMCSMISAYILDVKNVFIEVLPNFPSEAALFESAFLTAELYFRKLFNIQTINVQ